VLFYLSSSETIQPSGHILLRRSCLKVDAVFIETSVSEHKDTSETCMKRIFSELISLIFKHYTFARKVKEKFYSVDDLHLLLQVRPEQEMTVVPSIKALGKEHPTGS